MYKDTVTLFNRDVDSMGNTMWFPHVLTNVNLVIDRAVIVSKYGEESNDNAVLNIKYNFENEKIFINDKEYLMPKEWERQPNDLLVDFLTFKSGNEFDFFILGDYGSNEIIMDERGTFFREIQEQYDNVFAVTSVAKLSVIPHFEIVGK